MLFGSALAADLPAQAPAPLGVFGVDMPAPGRVVISLLPSYTRLKGIKIGTGSVSPQYVVTNITSPYTPVGAHILRLAPINLDVDSQGLAAAYGLSKNIALFASTAVLEKYVNMQAFEGLSGTTSLGLKTGTTTGFGDTTVASVIRIYRDPVNQVNVNFGLSLPTGSTIDSISLLLPNGTAPFKRGFYAMQPGTGTVDALPGITYSGILRAWSWGASFRARLPFDTNAEGYRYGDLEEFNGWGGYTWLPGFETTFRINASTQSHIHGVDPGILGYAQGSDPLFYGGQQVSLYGGVILGGKQFGLPAATLALEAGVPVYQDLNGPQLARDWQVNGAFRYKF